MKKIALILSLFLLVGCSTTVNSVGDTISLDDGIVTQAYPSNPETVVVFSYGVAETLLDLNIPIAGLPKENLPPSLVNVGDEVANVGTLKEPNFEAIASLAPDLIIIEARQLSMREEFEKIAPTIHMGISNESYMESFKLNMDNLEKLFKVNLEERVADIDAQIATIAATNQGLNAMMLMVNGDDLSVFGELSRFGIIYQDLGFAPVDTKLEDASHGQKVSYEYILEQNPDVIFVIDRSAVTDGQGVAKELLSNDIIAKTTAYQEDRIFSLDSHVWYTQTGGLKSTQTMLDEINNALLEIKGQ